MQRYINPYTDFGFKKLFGEEANKDLLIDFLNALLPKKHKVKTLDFLNPEILGVQPIDRRSVFDVLCEAKSGEKFILEMQKAKQAYFKDRSFYYLSQLIRQQGQKGEEWNFELNAVYFIGILDFIYEPNEPDKVLIRKVSPKDQFGNVFYDKAEMIYIQMPVFDKTESELESREDKWLFFLKNLPSLDAIPAILKEKVFKKAFHTAELASMSEKDLVRYEHDQKILWDNYAVWKTARDEGREEGREEGKTHKAMDIALNMKNEGFNSAMIAKITGLSSEEIKRLD